MHKNSTIEFHTKRRMPIIGLGTWKLDDDTANIISHALKVGYPMIDTSGDYGTQPEIAQGIKKSGILREDIYLITKVEETDNAYDAVQQNLEELQTDYADLILIHRPPDDGAGEDLWRDLIQAKKDGLTKDIGVSNYSINQIQKLIDTTGEVPVVNQIEWSPFGWDQSMMVFCKSNQIVIQAYSPLTHGQLLSHKLLKDIADKYEKTPAQILIRWCLQMATVPLPKANQQLHLEDNLKVFDFRLADEDMILLDELNENYSALGEQPVYQEN